MVRLRGASSNARPNEDENNEDLPFALPGRFHFSHLNYTKGCKFMMRCDISKVLNTLDKYLSDMELEWFKEHNQFKHLFHMPRERNRRLMGMWMLIMRTIHLNKQKEWWFVVNGVPVWYSIREHALISGLNCKVYPDNHLNLGGFDFVVRQFDRTEKIFLEDVETKLKTMSAFENRLQMGVLYLLSSVIRMKAKVPSPIDPFILQIVGDLEACKTFPWGRYTFEHCSEELNKMLTALNGKFRDKLSLTFPTFIIPLELLAFEVVGALKKEYRITFGGMRGCPRMCQTRFTEVRRTGYPLAAINETLADNKDICSILEATADEERMLALIWDIVVLWWFKLYSVVPY